VETQSISPDKREKRVLVYCGINNMDNFRILRPHFDVCYGFDANPQKVETAKKAYKNDPDVHMVFGALTQRGGETVDFHVTTGWDPSSTLGVFNPEFGHFKNGLLVPQTTIRVPTINLCDYCKQNDIGFIDLLILDLQGMDYSVLKTMEPFIREKRIAVIQAETEKDNSPPIHLSLPSNKLEDFKYLLSENYEIVKIAPDVVPEDWWEMDVTWQLKPIYGPQDNTLQRSYVINIVYQHLQEAHAHAVHKGPFSVIFTADPLTGCDLYAYLNADSFCGAQKGLDVLLLFEPIVVLPGQYNEDIWKHFDHIITPFEALISDNQRFTKILIPRSDFVAPVESTEDIAEREKKYPLNGRKNAICMINGHKTSSVEGELYSRRVDAARWFHENSDIPFDVFGNPPFSLPNYRGALEPDAKLATLCRYRYSLCFENVYHERFSAGYVSEKILDCLETRTVPIYLGACNIEEYVPKGCYIDFRQFGNFAELDRFLHQVSDKEYLEYVKNIDDWVSKGGFRPYSGNDLYDRLCYLIAGGRGLTMSALFESGAFWEAGLPPRLAHKKWATKKALRQWSWAFLASTPSRLLLSESVRHEQDLHEKLSDEYQSKGDHRRAVKELESAMAAGPVSVKTYCRYAQLCIAMQRYQEAIETLSRIVQIDPTHSQAHDDLGVLYSQAGDYKNAMKCFVVAYAADIDNYNSLRNILALSSQLGLAEQGKAFLNAALERNPGNTEINQIAKEFMEQKSIADTSAPVLTQQRIANGKKVDRMSEKNSPGSESSQSVDAMARCGPAAQKQVRNIQIMSGTQISADCQIGDYTYIGFNCFITRCNIGRYCSIANCVKIGQGEHDINHISTSTLFVQNPYQALTSAHCIIGNDVWIGVDSIIRRGVTIGDGAVIGANSFVNTDIPDYAIVAGSPARIVKYRFPPEIAAMIKASNWWNYDLQAASKIIDDLEKSIPKQTAAKDSTPGNQKSNNVTSIVFSKDRAMQLDCILRSFFKHCLDSSSVDMNVLYTASDLAHESQYKSLKEDYPSVVFVREKDFRKDLLSMLRSSDYTLFLVDDNIFVKDFTVSDTVSALYANENSIGFSLRLGRNTRYCYMLDRIQRLPDFQRASGDILVYQWVGADHDFGYPLEVSSSVYRTSDMTALLEKIDFRNPNTLELAMDSSKGLFSARRKELLCFEQSVAFCNPVNTVQKMWKNRSGTDSGHSLETLAEMFDKGLRINVEKFDGFVPNACHQEVQMSFDAAAPLLSVIILNYNGLEDIRPCVDSIVRNTPEPHEIIVFDNASTDGSLEYLRDLPGIVLVENTLNIGCPAGRAQAMSYIHRASKYLVFLDNDTIVTKGWASKFIAHSTNDPMIGMMGPRSNYVSGIQLLKDASYRTVDELEAVAAELSERNKGKLTPTHRLVGFCMFITRKVVDRLGSIDPSFGKFGFEDDDYTWRAIVAGFKTMVAEDVFIHHKGGPQGQGDTEYNRLLSDAWGIFKTKWGLPADLTYGTAFNIASILSQPYDRNKHYIAIAGPGNKDVRKGGSPDLEISKHYSEIEELVKNNKFADAVAILESLLETYPDRALLHNDLGVLHCKLGDPQKALFHYRRACTLEERNETFLRNLADLYLVEFKDTETALGYYLKVLKLNPTDTEVLSILGNICLSREQHTDALFFYRKVLEMDKNNAVAQEMIDICSEMEKKQMIPREEKYSSQYQQDHFLDQRVFNKKEGGFFLDIGAADGVCFSNTYFFETFRKWDGICIEPNPVVFEQLKKNRRCAKVNAAIAEKAGRARYLKVEGYAEMLSGLVDYYEKDHLARIDNEIRQYGGSKTEIEVETLNINDLLRERNIHHIDYCNIDVEGAEYEILKTIDFDDLEIDVLTVENNYGSPDMRDFMASRNYRLIAQLGCDDVFQRIPVHKQTGIPDPAAVGSNNDQQTTCRNTGPAIPGIGDAAVKTSHEKGTTIIIVLTDKPARLKDCVRSILDHTDGEDLEFVFISKEFDEKTSRLIRQLLKKESTYRLIADVHNKGFVNLVNEGISDSSKEFILLLDPSTVVTEGWLSGMKDCFHRATDTGIVGPMTNHTSESRQLINPGDLKSRDQIEAFASSFRTRNLHRRFNVFRLSGFCMLFRKRFIHDIGLLDPSFDYSLMAWDTDLSMRCSLAGLKNTVAADVYVHGSLNSPPKSSATLLAKWSAVDPLTAKQLAALTAVERSWLMFEKGKLENAIDVLMDGVKSAPDNRGIYLCLARILIDSREYKEALDALQSVATWDKHHPETLELSGYVLEALDRDLEADGCANELLSARPGYGPALDVKGLLAYKRGELGHAESLFRQAIQGDPGFAEPYRNLGLLKWTAGEKEEGLALMEKAFVLEPARKDNALAYLSAAIDRKACERAEAVLTEARTLYPDNRNIAVLLIDLLQRQDKTRLAMDEIQKCLVRFGANEDIVSIGLEIRDTLGPMAIDRPDAQQGTLSVCMIVKNEEKYIARCLKSLLPIADELIIVDTGSTDRTRDIASVFGAKVYDLPWTNDFAAARNASLERAKGQWILVHDADEVISPRDHHKIRHTLSRKTGKPVAFTMVTRNYTNNANLEGWVENIGEYPDEEEGVGWTSTRKVRLFTNHKGIRFQNSVHELLEFSLAELKVRPEPYDVPVHHYGKLDTERLAMRAEMYYDLGKKKFETRQDMQALRELAVQAAELRKYDEAISLWQRYAQFRPEECSVYVNMATCYLELGMFDRALEMAKQAMELDPVSKDAMLGYGATCLCKGNVAEAVSVLENLHNDQPGYYPATGILAAAYCISSDPLRGEALLKEMWSKRVHYGKALHSLAQKLISAGEVPYAQRLLTYMISTGHREPDSQQLLDELTDTRRFGEVSP